MTDEHGHNGWANYETWAMALHIDNDRGSYTYARDLADASDEVDGRTRAGLLADALKAWQDETRPDLGGTVWSDLLGAAFSSVDWYEIADAILSEEGAR